MKSFGACSLHDSDLRTGEILEKADSPLVEKRLICQNSLAAPSRKDCESIGWAKAEFKSILTEIKRNRIWVKGLAELAAKIQVKNEFQIDF